MPNPVIRLYSPDGTPPLVVGVEPGSRAHRMYDARGYRTTPPPKPKPKATVTKKKGT